MAGANDFRKGKTTMCAMRPGECPQQSWNGDCSKSLTWSLPRRELARCAGWRRRWPRYQVRKRHPGRACNHLAAPEQARIDRIGHGEGKACSHGGIDRNCHPPAGIFAPASAAYGDEAATTPVCPLHHQTPGHAATGQRRNGAVRAPPFPPCHRKGADASSRGGRIVRLGRFRPVPVIADIHIDIDLIINHRSFRLTLDMLD